MRGRLRGSIALLTAMLATCATLMTLGTVLVVNCVPDRPTDACYNDVQALYTDRWLSTDQLPYLHGSYDAAGTIRGALEYPVLTGLVAWVAVLPASTPREFFWWSVAALAPFALATVAMLWRMVGHRAWYVAASLPVVWYSFHSWDWPVVAVTVAGLWAWQRDKPVQAAGWLTVGVWLKFWPGLFLVPLFLALLKAGDRARALRSAAVVAAVSLVVNGPFLALNPSGWWAPYAFQSDRKTDFWSLSSWAWISGQTGHTAELNRLIAVSMLLVAAGVCAWAWRRPGPFPVVQVGAVLLCAFMLLGKANSPQFTLWLMPLFAVMAVRTRWWVTYMVVDLALFLLIFEYLGPNGQGEGIAFDLLRAAVLIRIGVLAGLAVRFATAPSLVDPPQVTLPATSRQADSTIMKAGMSPDEVTLEPVPPF